MVPRCRRCGEPIGVYEPLVVVVDGAARLTSRAAEPAVSTAPGEHYHFECHGHSQIGQQQEPREG